jgi:hypothetical protein
VFALLHQRIGSVVDTQHRRNISLFRSCLRNTKLGSDKKR